jgi:hypothetical protein
MGKRMGSLLVMCVADLLLCPASVDLLCCCTCCSLQQAAVMLLDLHASFEAVQVTSLVHDGAAAVLPH